MEKQPPEFRIAAHNDVKPDGKTPEQRLREYEELTAQMEKKIQESPGDPAAVAHLEEYYRLFNIRDKWEAITLKYPDLTRGSTEKVHFLRERKFRETGSLDYRELESLRWVAYESLTRYFPGRWLDQETPEQLLAILHIRIGMSKDFKHRESKENPDGAEHYRLAKEYDPDCPLFIWVKMDNIAREARVLPKTTDDSVRETYKKRIQACYKEIVAAGDRDILWRYIREEARVRHSEYFVGPSYIQTPETIARDQREWDMEEAFYKEKIAKWQEMHEFVNRRGRMTMAERQAADEASKAKRQANRSN